MQDTKVHGQVQVLYFEDDQDTAGMIADFLTSQGYGFSAMDSFPEGGLAVLREQMPQPPDIVLMDVSLKGLSGNDVCRQLRNGYLPEHCPIIFVSGMMGEQDILRAYECGANDYMAKPIRLQELAVKLEHHLSLARQAVSLQENAATARNLAFEAMTTSSELGAILRFHEQSQLISDFHELGKQLLLTINSFGVNASVMFFGEKPLYVSDDNVHRPIEAEVLESFHQQDRIFSWKKRTFFNYENFSVLIRNMPIDNDTRYGILKDQFCLLLNGLEGRVRSIHTELRNERQKRDITIIANVIGRMVVEMEQNNVNLSARFEHIINEMENKVSADLLKFNLLEAEENTLMTHIQRAIKESSDVFDKSLKLEKQYRDTMTRLLNSLATRQR